MIRPGLTFFFVGSVCEVFVSSSKYPGIMAMIQENKEIRVMASVDVELQK